MEFVYFSLEEKIKENLYLEKCTAWDKASFESLAGCINCGWVAVVWLLDIKQITDNRHFEEIKRLLGEKNDF